MKKHNLHMKQQSYKNHTRLVPLYHFLTFGLILLTFIGSLVNLYTSMSEHREENLYSASLLLVISVILIFMFFFSRIFALRAQDRAIRAEENLRHFALTGRLLDKRLRLGQIIALRFAADEEFAALAHQAAEKNMSPRDIKQAVQDWRADHHRA